MRLATGLLAAAVVVAGSACTQNGERSATRRPIDQRPELVHLSGCAGVEATIRLDAIDSLNRSLDALLADYPAQAARLCERKPGARDDVSFARMGAFSSASGPSVVSHTNTQVPGVDEPDTVKNDSRYIYLLAAGHLHILDAWPADRTRAIARVPVEGQPLSMLVDSNRVVVISAIRTSSNSSTQVSSYDLSFAPSPRLIRTLVLSGKFLAARRIGPVAHIVVSDPELRGLSAKSADEVIGCPPTPIEKARESIERFRAESTKLIEGARLEGLPSIVDALVDYGIVTPRGDVMRACPNFYGAQGQGQKSFVTILSMDLRSLEPVATTTLLTAAGTSYVSRDAFYLSVPQASEPASGQDAAALTTPATSVVHKVQLFSDPPATSYVATGVVKGHALNQFAMDEQDEYLRIATGSPRGNGRGESAVTVLKQEGNLLRRVGIVDMIAPGEDMKSVRFDGDRGFVVTFRRTDPLFVLELSAPAAPHVLGELKIPGYSTYVHTMDPTHLLTVGYDSDDATGQRNTGGVSLQIFAVGDPAEPRLVHKEVVGIAGTGSNALTDHRAFNYVADTGLLLLPMNVREPYVPGQKYARDWSFSGLLVYKATPEQGFCPLGSVEHSEPQYNKGVQMAPRRFGITRSVVMDEFIYSISDNRVTVHSFKDLTRAVAEVSLFGR